MRLVCPTCAGRFFLSPKSHFHCGKCPMCDDNKWIDPEIVCQCGRPAVKIVNGILICTLAICNKRATDAVKSETEQAVEKNVNWFEQGIYDGAM